jgi:hypothetical protein
MARRPFACEITGELARPRAMLPFCDLTRRMSVGFASSLIMRPNEFLAEKKD